MQPVRLTVYSDYLCPWCYNATVRMRRLEEEFAAALEIRWHSFLLRPEPVPQRDLGKFRAYTESWLRPAAEPDSGTFRVWESDQGPPSHSVPPHLAAKAAESLGPGAFDRLHDRLLHAYFAENRDVTDRETLRAIWLETGLPEEEFRRINDPALLERTLEEHRRAIERGVNGVPAVEMEGTGVPVTGALPLESYRQWIRKALDRTGERNP